MKIPFTRFKWADRVQVYGKTNGWSTCTGIALLPNDVAIRFAYCGPTCNTRPNTWLFIPVRERRYRDRGERCFQFCSQWDVPELLRKLMQRPNQPRFSRNGYPTISKYRRPKKDPRVGNEMQALALGCTELAEPQPLWDWLLEHHGIEHGINGWNIDPAIAGAIARWEWPF